MKFTLEEQAIDDIIFAMEDQSNTYVLDSHEGTLLLVSEDNFSEAEDSCVSEKVLSQQDNDGTERYFELPSWTSDDGFKIIEKFTNNLKSPQVHRELKKVLACGRGVFRNFKNTLRKYPEVERRYNVFKDETMKRHVILWYNSLREEWGLEGLAVAETDFTAEMEDLLYTDFEFGAFTESKDKTEIAEGEKTILQEYSSNLDKSLANALAYIYSSNLKNVSAEKKAGFVCRTINDDFAGTLLFANCPSQSEEAVLITDFFVKSEYRGLGIAKELVKLSINFLKNQKTKFMLVAQTIIPESLENILKQNHFERWEAGFVLDLRKTV